MDFDHFKRSHAPQLERVPEIYWQALHEKLMYEAYDAGKYFTMCPGEEGWKVVVSTKDKLSTDDPSCIYLVDHAWTFQPQSVQSQLLKIPGLAHRMASLMDLGVSRRSASDMREESYEADSESGDERTTWSNDDTDTEEANNQSESTSTSEPHPLTSTLSSQDGYRSGDLGDMSHASFTDAPDNDSDSDSEVPRKSFMERYAMCNDGTEDLSNLLDQFTIPDKPDSVPTLLPQQRVESITQGQLKAVEEDKPDEEGQQNPALTSMLEPPSDEVVGKIMERMWRYCYAYHINNSQVPVWYIMDEFGSRIQQSTEPTVSIATFFYIPTQLAFSLLWPVKELHCGDEVTCNYLPECVKPGLDQLCHSLPWSHDQRLSLNNPLWKELGEFKIPDVEERCSEELPDPLSQEVPPTSPKTHFNVYTDLKLVQTFLTHPSFVITSSKKEADILWLSEHFKKFRSLKPGQFVNQFPCENVLTCKDLLVTVARRANQEEASSSIEAVTVAGPTWLPLTFNLLYELPHFVHCFVGRKEKGQDNLWILKPWNLGRGMDIHITDNLVQMIKLAQAGPKIASKYITDPVLFNCADVGLVKFDIRYVLLLRSVKPLTMYVYDVFWLRFANKPFSLDNFTDYEKHFTVMNYRDESELNQIHYDEFVPLFEEQYPEHKWSSIQNEIFSILKELFTAACSVKPPAGLGSCNQSRAIYAVDLMLEWEDKSLNSGNVLRKISPKVLEVNFSPDCIRACKYHPEFYNHILQVLFLNDSTAELPVTQLL